MFGIGGQELVLLMVIGLIVLGPERLPRIANQMGSWLGQARRMTRVMKRQLEEELDLDKSPTIKPPPVAKQPSFKADIEKESVAPDDPAAEEDLVLPRDDDEYSPAHGEDDVGTGVGDEVLYTEEDVAAADAERDAVDEAAASNEDAEEEKKATS
jgi:sec-independent protein translocase protein TatB